MLGVTDSLKIISINILIAPEKTDSQSAEVTAGLSKVTGPAQTGRGDLNPRLRPQCDEPPPGSHTPHTQKVVPGLLLPSSLGLFFKRTVHRSLQNNCGQAVSGGRRRTLAHRTQGPLSSRPSAGARQDRAEAFKLTWGGSFPASHAPCHHNHLNTRTPSACHA